MDTLFFLGIPTVLLTSYILIKRSDITKADCVQYSIDTIESMHNVYTCISNHTHDIFDSYTKTQYKECEIISKKQLKNAETEIVYNYNDQLFNIIYDMTYPINNKYNVGDIIDTSEILTSVGHKNIVLIEFIHNETNATTLLHKTLSDYIIRIAGPNQDFYNRDGQPLYIDNTILDAQIIDNIDRYHIQITYMDLKVIQKKIIII